MTRCLHCQKPADVTLHTTGKNLPAGLLLDLCADHAALNMARGEAAIHGPNAGIPVVQLSPSIGAFYGGAIGFLLTLGAGILLWKVFA